MGFVIIVDSNKNVIFYNMFILINIQGGQPRFTLKDYITVKRKTSRKTYPGVAIDSSLIIHYKLE